MPTFEQLPRFALDWKHLESADRKRFKQAVREFCADLAAGRAFRQGLRVKRVQGTPDVWELTFAPDGRATWQYGDEVCPGEPHIIWRRIGTHGIFRSP